MIQKDAMALDQAGALVRAGRVAEAEALLRRVAKGAGHPGIALAALAQLASLLHDRGRFDEAVSTYRLAIRQQPNDASLHYNLGIVLRDCGRLDAAVDAYRKAIALAPGLAQAHNNLGTALKGIGRLDESEQSLHQAIQLKPDYVQAYNNLGNTLSAQGRFVDAEGAIKTALRLRPDYADGWNNLGQVYRDSGAGSAAQACFRRVLELAPQHADGWRNLAATQRSAGDPGGAQHSLRQALALNPKDAQAFADLGAVLFLDGDLTQAIEHYESAFRLRPDDGEILGNLVHLYQHACRWDGLAALQKRLLTHVRRGGSGVAPFFLCSIAEASPADQLQCARVASAPLSKIAPLAPRLVQDGNERPRIGYVSADFRGHPVAYLIAETFELHDRHRFEVFGYSLGPTDGSPIRRRIEAAFDGFVDCRALSDDEVAQRIRTDRIDILVDLTGHTNIGRPGIFARRPAPVQVNYLGYPGTSGAAFMDAIIADDRIVPAAAVSGYSERVMRLPVSYQMNDRRREIGDTPDRAAEGLLPDALVLASFANSFKITPEMFSTWTSIARQVPNAVLWLLEPPAQAKARLEREWSKAGLDPARLIFAAKAPLPRHLARHRLADLFLDTFPYGGHTGTSDALWAGVPVVTRQGQTFAARVAASLLVSCGLDDLVALDQAHYSRLVLDLAGSPSRLQAARAVLATPSALALFDSPARVAELEAVYAALLAGQGVAHSAPFP